LKYGDIYNWLQKWVSLTKLGTNVSLYLFLYLFLTQTTQSAMFSRFIDTEKHKNNAWQLQKRLNELSAAIDDRVKEHYHEPQLQQLVR